MLFNRPFCKTKPVLLLISLLVLGTASFALETASATTHLTPNPVLTGPLNPSYPGLGSSYPPVPNVSQDPSFMVYEWTNAHGRVLQINNLQGTPLAIVSLMRNHVTIAKLGGSGPRPVGAYQCPCSGSVLVSGPGLTVIAVSDQGGTLVAIVTCTAHACKTQKY